MTAHEHNLRPPTPEEEERCAKQWGVDAPWRVGKGILMVEDYPDDPAHPDFWYIENEVDATEA